MYAAVDGNKNPAPVNGHPPENQHDKRWKIQHLSRCISYFSHGYFSNVILVFRGVHRSSYYFAGKQDIRSSKNRRVHSLQQPGLSNGRSVCFHHDVFSARFFRCV